MFRHRKALIAVVEWIYFLKSFKLIIKSAKSEVNQKLKNMKFKNQRNLVFLILFFNINIVINQIVNLNKNKYNFY